MWLVLKHGGSAESVLMIQIIFNFILLTVRLGFAVKYCHISLGVYLRDVVGRLAAALVAGGVIPLALAFATDGYTRLIVTTAASLAAVPLATLFVAFPKAERTALINLVKKRLPHGKK